MSAPTHRACLHVEGMDDFYTIANLVKLNGFDHNSDTAVPDIECAKNIDKLLRKIRTAIRLGEGRTLGFVLDADDSLTDRWASVRQRLGSVGVADVPPEPPEKGFIGESTSFQSRVGVWLMPDNRRPGALELFLQELVPADDPIFSHARSATEQAGTLGASFREVDTLKATIHAWLAWQEVPGLPYGIAIQAQYLNHEHPSVRRFIDWYSSLYQLPPSA